MPEDEGEDQTLLDPELLQQRVGAVALAAAAVEMNLLLLVAEMIDSPAGSILARGQQSSTLIDWCERLAIPPITPEQLEEPIRRHLVEARALLEQRHDVVHGRWFHIEPRGAFTVRLKRKNSVQRDWTDGALAALRRDLVNLAGDLALDLRNLRHARAGEPLIGPRVGDVDDLDMLS